MSLANKIALVTGASSGIGAAIAIKFTEEGAKVAIVGRNECKLKNVSEICEKRGNKPLSIVADLSKDADAKRIVNDVIIFFGCLDILVNNAGIGYPASIMDDNAMEVYNKVINTNLRSTIYLTHLAVKKIIERKGNIINISSIAAQSVLTKTSFSYGISKAGLDHFTRSIAFELGPKGVRVNAINPGPVKTDIIENSGGDKSKTNEAWDSMRKTTVLDKIGEAEEIADLTAFLASDKARSVTGSTFIIDNGAILLGPLEKNMQPIKYST